MSTEKRKKWEKEGGKNYLNNFRSMCEFMDTVTASNREFFVLRGNTEKSWEYGLVIFEDFYIKKVISIF